MSKSIIPVSTRGHVPEADLTFSYDYGTDSSLNVRFQVETWLNIDDATAQTMLDYLKAGQSDRAYQTLYDRFSGDLGSGRGHAVIKAAFGIK
jgi:hypothetical protein